jgi:uncharacterized protein
MDIEIKNSIKNRRSFYAIGKDKSISDDEIEEIVRHAVTNTPSAFNSQSGRVLLLLGGEHDKLWDLTKEILRAIIPPDKFAPTDEKIDSFKNGYGTVLYFEDQDVVKNLEQSFPTYAQNFAGWSLQGSAMLQYGIWLMLEDAGLGASLQHYNPLIDEKVKSAWNLPEAWKLIAEMPFGGRTGEPDTKTFLPLDDRIKIFK